MNTKIINRHDVWMVERTRCTSFELEVSELILIPCKRSEQCFHGTIPQHSRIARTINFPHTARSKERLNFVWPDTGTRFNLHTINIAPWSQQVLQERPR